MSTYSGDMTGEQWLQIIQTRAGTLLGEKDQLEQVYKKWYASTYGMTNADIAVKLGISETEIIDMQAVFAVFSDLYGFFTNAAVISRDRSSDLIKFA